MVADYSREDAVRRLHSAATELIMLEREISAVHGSILVNDDAVTWPATLLALEDARRGVHSSASALGDAVSRIKEKP